MNLCRGRVDQGELRVSGPSSCLVRAYSRAPVVFPGHGGEVGDPSSCDLNATGSERCWGAAKNKDVRDLQPKPVDYESAYLSVRVSI